MRGSCADRVTRIYNSSKLPNTYLKLPSSEVRVKDLESP